MEKSGHQHKSKDFTGKVACTPPGFRTYLRRLKRQENILIGCRNQ